MGFGLVSGQNQGVAHFLPTFVTLNALVHVKFVGFKSILGAICSMTLITLKWGVAFMLGFNVFSTSTLTSKSLFTVSTSMSLFLRLGFFIMHTSNMSSQCCLIDTNGRAYFANEHLLVSIAWWRSSMNFHVMQDIFPFNFVCNLARGAFEAVRMRVSFTSILNMVQEEEFGIRSPRFSTLVTHVRFQTFMFD